MGRKRKISKFLTSAVIISLMFALSGCTQYGEGKQEAYKIREEGYRAIQNRSDSKQEKPLKKDSTEEDTNDTNNMKHKVNASQAKIVGAKDTINYNGFSLQIEEVRIGSNIYDSSGMLPEKEEQENFQRLVDKEKDQADPSIKANGEIRDKDKADFLFIKCKIKNNNKNKSTLSMSPSFYAQVDNKEWGSVSSMTYEYSGRHELYHDPKTQMDFTGHYTFEPEEELETVFTLEIFKKGNPSKYVFGYQNENVKVYMFSNILDGKAAGAGGYLKSGTYLIPILDNGKIITE